MFAELTLIGAFVFYTLEVIAIAAVAMAGIFVGKKLRDRKNKKSKEGAANE